MFKISRDLYDYEPDIESELVDDAIFHEGTIIPKEIFLSKFDLLPKFSEEFSSSEFSSENTGLEFTNERYNGLLEEAIYTYQRLECIEKHKFYINNIIRNNFTQDLNNIEKFDENCKLFFNSITMISQFKLASENDAPVLQEFIEKYLNIKRLINESIDLIKKYSTAKYDEYVKKVESIAPLMREIVDSGLLDKVNVALYNSKINVKVSLKNAELKDVKVFADPIEEGRITTIKKFICNNILIQHTGRLLTITGCKCDSITTFSARSNNTNALLLYHNIFNVLNYQNDDSKESLAYFKNNQIIQSIKSFGCDYVYFEDDNILKNTIINDLKQEIELRQDNSYLNVDFSDDVLKTFLETIKNVTKTGGEWKPPTADPILRLPPAITAVLKMNINIPDLIFQYKLDMDKDYDLIYKLIQFLIK